MADISYTSAVIMRSQFLQEHKLVDLNCGKYCTEAAARWAQGQYNLGGTSDIFNGVLGKTGMLQVAWSPAKEGRSVASPIGVPPDADGWYTLLKNYGPLMTSRSLKLCGHYVLVTGIKSSTIEYKDPLRGDAAQEESMIKFTKKILDTNIYYISKSGLKAKLASAPPEIGLVDLP